MARSSALCPQERRGSGWSTTLVSISSLISRWTWRTDHKTRIWEVSPFIPHTPKPPCDCVGSFRHVPSPAVTTSWRSTQSRQIRRYWSRLQHGAWEGMYLIDSKTIGDVRGGVRASGAAPADKATGRPTSALFNTLLYLYLPYYTKLINSVLNGTNWICNVQPTGTCLFLTHFLI